MTTTFEFTTCGRCGGSGQYSFNQIDGTRCYGCGGTGLKLTKRGAAAKAHYDAALIHVASELSVGDQIFTQIGLGARRFWQTITAIEADEHNPGQNRITLSLSRKGKPTQSYGVFGNTELASLLCSKGEGNHTLEEAKAAAVAFQETLTKSGKQKKSAA